MTANLLLFAIFVGNELPFPGPRGAASWSCSLCHSQGSYHGRVAGDAGSPWPHAGVIIPNALATGIISIRRSIVVARWRLEATMNISTLCGALVLGGLVAMIAPSTASYAQSNDRGVSAPKQTGASAPSGATPNTNTNPTKHRHWRHRGGKHPHYGSRRVHT